MDTKNSKSTGKAPCDRCGQPEGKAYGDHWYCDECFHILSSTDLEEGEDDQWRTDDLEKAHKKTA